MPPAKPDLKERVAALSPAQLQELQARVRERKTRTPELQRRGPDEPVPLSCGQQRFWLLDQLSPGNPAYNETNSLRFNYALDPEVFRRAVNEIVRRHESLRMSVHEVDGVAFQNFAPSITITIPVVDLRYLPSNEREKEAMRFAAEQSRMPFDLCHGPLIRASLYRIDAADYLFVLTLHHMVCDGWSMGVLMVELVAIYWSFIAGKPSPLAVLPIQYGDFAVWQQHNLLIGAHRHQLAYWQERLRELPTLQFPTDRPRTPEFSFHGAREQMEISGPAFASLGELARQQNTTLFNVLLSIFVVLLHRYTEEEDIAIGAPSAGRSRRELEPLIGCFINTLVLRVSVTPLQTFFDVLGHVRNTTAEAHANQDVPFERLVEALQPKRDPSRNPLVQVMFQLFTQPSAAGLREDVLLPFTPVDSGIAKVDLSLELIWSAERIRGHVEYNTDLFDRGRIARLIGHFLQLIESVIADPLRRIAELRLLTSEEERQSVIEWNKTSAPFPRDSTIPEVFREQMQKSPNAPAVRFKGRTLKYVELRDSAAVIAAALVARGITPGDLVGVYLDRGVELPVALLGILEAGCAYMPVDPSYPPERIAYLFGDSGVSAMVTTAKRASELALFTGPVISVDEPMASSPDVSGTEVRTNSDTRSSSADVAYVMYTSGTTGKPKGVAVTHRNILRLVKNVSYVKLEHRPTVLHFAPLSFDASTFEIWGCLLNGGVLAIHPPGVPSLEELGVFIKREKISLLFLTTNLFTQMVEHCSADLRGVDQVITGGESLSLPSAKAAWKALPHTRLANAYGPTECTAFATLYPIGAPETLREPVPIGRPIENTTIYIFDRSMNVMPVGVPGELYIGGDGVAANYWRRPELTAEKFVPDPFVPAGRLYRTGDVGCYREDGNLLFLGRRDRQVKLSGFRVELGEVESALLAHPDVRAAVVVVIGAWEKRLIAYCEARPNTALSAAEMRRFLSEKLPHHMVPAKIEMRERIPLTTNGKIDVEKLAMQDSGDPAPSETFIAARTPVERTLADLWSNVLELAQVGATDNFFELGGHSLLAMQILSRVRNEFGVQVAMREFFDHPTIAGLAGIVGQRLVGNGVALAASSQNSA